MQPNQRFGYKGLDPSLPQDDRFAAKSKIWAKRSIDNFSRYDKLLNRMIKKKITYISEESQERQEQVKQLKKKLKICQKEKEGYLAQAQRARADLINFRRRQEEAEASLSINIESALIRDFLPILDSLKAGAEKNEGIKQVLRQFEQELAKRRIEEIDALGQKFNPQIHEAVGEIASEKKSGTIVEVVQIGYAIGSSILRPSKVKIAK